MLLNGKDLQVLPGALMIFLHVPFTRVEKDLSPGKKNLVEKIYDRVDSLCDELYRASCRHLMAQSEIVACRLRQQGYCRFSTEELEALIELLKLVIEEDRPEASHNVYFNGDEYGITLSDFRDLLSRMEEDLAARRAVSG